MTNLLLSDNITLDESEADNIWHNINSSPSDQVSYRILIASFIFAVFGSVSNLMSVIVLHRLSSQLSTFVYLTGLSLSDMITCISIVMVNTLEFIVESCRTTSTTIFLRYVGIVLGGLAAGSRVLSLWISTAVTMDRWILICYPVYGKTFCTLKRAKVVSRALFIIAFLYSIPLFFEYELVQMPSVFEMIQYDNISTSSVGDNLYTANTLVIKGYSDLARRRLYRWSYMFFNAIFVYTLPTITIVCFNLQLIRALHRVKSRTKRLRQKFISNGHNHFHIRRSSQSKYSVTIIVIVMVLTLLICRSPTIVLWVLWSFELTIKIFFDSPSSAAVRRFHNIANLIAIINAATNFLPFCVFGQLFRAECLNIYCCRSTSNEQSLQQTTKKSDFVHANVRTSPRSKTGNDMHQLDRVRSDLSQSAAAVSAERFSPPQRSTSLNSTSNMIRLQDSPFQCINHERQHSKMLLTASPLSKETVEL